MNDPNDIIAFFINRIENASHPAEKQIIRDDLFLYYYRLTAEECEATRPQMQALLDEVRLEVESYDPLLKRTGELLRSLNNKKYTVLAKSA